MAFVTGDRILETITATFGTGTPTLAGAVSGYRAFSAVATANGDRFLYTIAAGTNWEVGIGVRLSATTFTRSEILSSSNSNALVNFPAGTYEAWIDDPAKAALQAISPQPAANILLNSRFEVDQDKQGTPATVGNTASAGYMADQWLVLENAANIGCSSVAGTTQGTMPIANQFPKALLISTTTGGSIGASEIVEIFQPVEGYRIAKLGYSAAGAATSTICFWVYATITGQATFWINNGATDRSFVKSFTINAALTWEFKTIKVPGDVTGTWPTGSTLGANVGISAACGSTFNGTDGIWQAGEKHSVSGQTNFLATTGNLFSVTGFCWFPGDLILPEHLSGTFGRAYGEDLPLCERYYLKIPTVNGSAISVGSATGTSGAWAMVIPLPTEMASNPTASLSSNSHFNIFSAAVNSGITSVTWSTTRRALIVDTVTISGSGMTNGHAAVLYSVNASGYVQANARLI